MEDSTAMDLVNEIVAHKQAHNSNYAPTVRTQFSVRDQTRTGRRIDYLRSVYRGNNWHSNRAYPNLSENVRAIPNDPASLSKGNFD